MKTQNELVKQIEAMLIKRIDTAKQFRDEASAQGNAALATSWDVRAGAFQSAMVSVLEIAADE
jgi:hypothetical protein